jgi:AraC family transcriptional regulator, transcriptional activator of pobA
MDKIENLEEFYKSKFDKVPNNIHNDIGHFNVFSLEPFLGDNPKPIPYKRRDFYKITLFIGNNYVQYADKVLEIKKQGLLFSNPQIPYQCINNNSVRGYFCVFNQAFFHDFGNLTQYELFQPNGTPIFELSDEQLETAVKHYERMLEEINSDYVHKYDYLRTIVLELIHFALKMQPSMSFVKQQTNANKRISRLFTELLERQFPIDENHQAIKLRSASDFAEHLNIHVNHLNRAIKDTSEKTTTQIISERLLVESKILLKQTVLNVSEIAYSLGFTEVSHFNNFFKKHANMSPIKYRNV